MCWIPRPDFDLVNRPVSVAGCLGYDVLVTKVVFLPSLKQFQLLVV